MKIVGKLITKGSNKAEDTCLTTLLVGQMAQASRFLYLHFFSSDIQSLQISSEETRLLVLIFDLKKEETSVCVK